MPRIERGPVVVAGTAPLLLRAAEVLGAQGVAVRRLADLSRSSVPRGSAALLLADDADLALNLERAAAIGTQRRPLRVLVLAQGAGGEVQLSRAPASAGAGSEAEASTLRVEWIDPYRTGARALLARWPLHGGFDPVGGQRLHLVIVGFGPWTQALLLHAMRIGQYAEEPPVVTLLAEDPALWRAWIETNHPQADVCAVLRFGFVAAPEPTGQGADAPAPAMIVVGDLAPAAGLSLARDLLRRQAQCGASPPILLAMEAEWRAAPLADWDGQLVPVRPLDLGLSREVLLDGGDDLLAEVIHEHYRDTSAAQGREPAAEPSGRPWEALGSSYRDANRHQADHLWAKLAVTDCRAVPEELVESFAFAPAEVERLAIIEHRRWAVERWLDGWTYGAPRDNARKLHPQLIPYADLSGPMQDLDRFAVRLVPGLLARSGLGVVRRLVVGVRGMASNETRAASPGALGSSMQRVLERLAARYPDRGLTIALDPADALCPQRRPASLGALRSRRLCAAPAATRASTPRAERQRSRRDPWPAGGCRTTHPAERC
jgi:hypothetical protein